MTNSEPEEQASESEDAQLGYELKSAKEAAQLLRVSESTVWRYAEQDLLPSYRVGRKRVMFRRSDLESLLNRVRRKKEPMAEKNNLRLFAMSEGAAGAADVVSRAKSLQAEVMARRGGAVLTASWEVINEARDERADAL